MGDGVSRDKRTSVAVADVDRAIVAPLGCRDATLTDCLCSHSVPLDLLHVGCHHLLADGVVCCCLVNEESAVVLFDHVLIIRGQQWQMGQTADTWSGVTVIHAIGSPLAGHFQITMGSPYFANHTEQRR